MTSNNKENVNYYLHSTVVLNFGFIFVCVSLFVSEQTSTGSVKLKRSANVIKQIHYFDARKLAVFGNTESY